MTNDKIPSGLAKLALASAAEAAEAEELHSKLPRLLRVALAERGHAPLLRERLFREIVHLAPDLEEPTQAWLDDQGANTVALAAALEARSIAEDAPNLNSLAHCVRLLGLADRQDLTEEHRKVGAALVASVNTAHYSLDTETRARLDKIILGWALVTARLDANEGGVASDMARHLARHRLEHVVQAALESERRANAHAEERKNAEKAGDSASHEEAASGEQPGFVRVCNLSQRDVQAKRLADLIAPLKNVINQGVPLARTPDLAHLRKTLIFEFPYAQQVIEAILEDLLGREFVRIRPMLLVGRPGGGKSTFARRVAELLGAGSWRVDASASDGGMLGGTARRWNTAEPCHSLLAIARAGLANTTVIVDEVEKAATRTDYGRLWDTLLGLLESETASRYPDPALQTNVDLSHVSYIATANVIDPLPKPLRDRMRVLVFPTPTAADLHALLPSLVQAYSVERGQDSRWVEPLSAVEIEAIAATWSGGSVRRLKRAVEAAIRAREHSAVRH